MPLPAAAPRPQATTSRRNEALVRLGLLPGMRTCRVLLGPKVAFPPHASRAATRPATTRTPLGAARHTATADTTEHAIATQKPSV